MSRYRIELWRPLIRGLVEEYHCCFNCLESLAGDTGENEFSTNRRFDIRKLKELRQLKRMVFDKWYALLFFCSFAPTSFENEIRLKPKKNCDSFFFIGVDPSSVLHYKLLFEGLKKNTKYINFYFLYKHTCIYYIFCVYIYIYWSFINKINKVRIKKVIFLVRR